MCAAGGGVIVEEVDVASGGGNDRARGRESGSLRFHDPGVVITDLVVPDYDTAGRLKARSLHPGVSAEQVEPGTDFPIGASAATPTRQQADEELRLIRGVIHPRGLRHREVRS